MIGYPLDSVVEFDDNGSPMFDRAISSAPLRELIKRLFTDGILPDRSNDLRVQYVGTARVSGEIEGATDTYNVVVNPGFGVCGGCLKLQENYYGLEMDVSTTTYPRIDTVVMRLDDNFDVRSCTFYIKRGEEAPSPTPPSLTRNSTVWEIGLANINKPPTVSTANPVTVTDTRLDTSRCGIISSVSEFDTAGFYDQIQEDLAHFKGVNGAEFTTWFANLRTQLAGDVAANLQKQIGALPLLVTANKTDLVSAINEVFSGSIAKTPTRTISVASSQTLFVDPIPTSWQQVVAGTQYQSGGYKITASGYASGYEVYKAFDDTVGTSWRTPSGTQHTLILELPEEILIDKVHLQFDVQGTATVSLQSSSDGGTSWTTEASVNANASYNADIVLDNAPRIKYLRILVNASSAVTFTLQAFEIVDYIVYTLNASFTLSNLTTLVNGQVVLVQIDPTHDATGVVSNTLNGVPVRSILQAGKRYELTYYTTYFTAKEVG